MLNMKYTGEEIFYPVNFKTVTANVIQLLGDFPIKNSGFTVYRENGKFLGDYSAFTTTYREIEGGAQFSNDGSIYVAPPEPQPIPIPEPTLEELQEQKVVEMNSVQQSVIAEGVDVTLTDGNTYHFSLTTNDQLSIIGSAASGEISVKGTPWHIADESVHCQYYSDEDMALISKASYEYVLYHVTYFRDLRIYIRSLTDKEEVENIYYGVVIPEEYRSEVLADMYDALGV